MSRIVTVKPSQAITDLVALEKACKDCGVELRQRAGSKEYDLRLQDGWTIGLRQTEDGYVFSGDNMVLEQNRPDIGLRAGTLVARYRQHALTDDLRERGFSTVGQRETETEIVLEFERYGRA